jgi:hypothetical protein
MSTAAEVNINTYSDADFSYAFQMGMQDPNGVNPVVPYDLTGHTLLMMVRKDPDDAEVFISLTSADIAEIDITDPANGLFSIMIGRDRLQRMEPGDYVHSLIMVQPSGVHEDVWRGILTHADGPTR